MKESRILEMDISWGELRVLLEDRSGVYIPIPPVQWLNVRDFVPVSKCAHKIAVNPFKVPMATDKVS
jgi:hypothetical protein